ncbi:aldo/keto reductase [Eubacteriales bacterium OttesenSCG-928-M02]|nr:aldo/keto reductase [Eubacteriales bacterium OttesenSCG-928-M02]
MLEKVALGKTGLMVDRICLGGGSFGGTTAPELVMAQLDYFKDLGGRFIDTALLYCDWLKIERSSSMKLIGKWLKDNGCRQDMVLSAKGCHGRVVEPTGNALTTVREAPDVRRARIQGDIQESMALLGTDYLDIFTLHNDNEDTPVEEVIDTLQAEKDAGRIRAYGCSNWRIARQRAAYDYALVNGKDGFFVDQMSFNLNLFAPGANGLTAGPYMDAEAYDFHRETGIPVMAYAANGRAYFHRKANGMEIGPAEQREYDCPENEAILQVLVEASKETGVEVNTIVIKYLLLDHGFQVVPIVGIKTPKELDICLAALDYELPKEYEEKLRALKGL